MGIKLRILLLVLLVVLVTTVSLGTLAFSRARGALERFIGAALANAAVETLDKIDRVLAERSEDLRHWARLDAVVKSVWGEIDPDLKVLRFFDEIRKTFGHVSSLLVVSSDGKIQAATDAKLIGAMAPPQLRTRKPSDGVAVRYAGPMPLGLVGHTALVLAVPVDPAQDGSSPGELICLLDFAEVTGIINAVRVTAEKEPSFMLLDSAGRPIGSSAVPGPLLPARLSDPSGFLVLDNPATRQHELVGYARSSGRSGFPGLGWTLLFRISSHDAFAPVFALRAQVVQLGLGLALAVLLVGLPMAIKLVRPIERITQAMTRVREGDFETSLELRASGEIGRMVEAFNFMLQGLKDREYIRDVFSRHVSPVVARKLLSERDALELSGERRRATILFTDIRSFTTLSEQLPAAEVVALLNEYFTEMVAVVFRYDGFVNKFIGDALMAVWGAPYDVPGATARAAMAALEMQERIEAISARRKAKGLPAVVMGIGFTTGDVIAGKIGSPERMEYTVIGDEVNIASRIEGLTKQFSAPVMMSESSYREIAGSCLAEELGAVKVKGREQPITVYRLVSMTIRPEELEGLPSGS